MTEYVIKRIEQAKSYAKIRIILTHLMIYLIAFMMGTLAETFIIHVSFLSLKLFTPGRNFRFNVTGLVIRIVLFNLIPFMLQFIESPNVILAVIICSVIGVVLMTYMATKEYLPVTILVMSILAIVSLFGPLQFAWFIYIGLFLHTLSYIPYMIKYPIL